MNALQSRVQIDPSDDDGVGLKCYELRSDNVAERQVSASRHRAHGAEHELKRRQFANGPDACGAANMLEQALGMACATAVTAWLERRVLRRVDFRYKRDFMGGLQQTAHDGRSGVESR